MARHSLTLVLTFLSSLSLSLASPDPRWLVPNGSNADLSTNWIRGQAITISWQALNASICDLWLTGWNVSENNYATRLASNINIENAGTLPWTIGLSSEQISVNDKFVLRFIPTGTEYQGRTQFVQVSSPGFIILALSPSATSIAATSFMTATAMSTIGSSGTQTVSLPSISATSTAPASTDVTSFNSSPPSGGGLSSGVKIGAAVAAVSVICIIIGLLLWVTRLRRRVKAVRNHRSQGIIHDPKVAAKLAAEMEMTTQEKHISGLHEAQGDKLQPQEMSTQKERKSVYEMPG